MSDPANGPLAGTADAAPAAAAHDAGRPAPCRAAAGAAAQADAEPASGPATSPTRFVLVEPSHAGNVGAAARALAVMGFDELVLVRPRRAGLQTQADALAMASGAAHVLALVRECATLDEALAGCSYACATAMTPRDFGPPTAAPRAHLAALAADARAQAPRAHTSVAFVFGPERTGLANDDVYRCNVCLSIPTAPSYGSLNLAQAVQILAYEWRQALGGFDVVARTPPVQPADLGAVEGLLAHWRELLVASGFLDPQAPKKLMPRLRRLLQRAQPTAEEVHILRGMARALDPRLGRRGPRA